MPDKNIGNLKNASNGREGIIQAALIVFSEKGYKAATIFEIASLAEYSAGNIYRHFDSKKTLFIETIQSFYFKEEFSDLFANAAKHKPEEFLKMALIDRFSIKPALLKGFVSLLGEFIRDDTLKEQYFNEIVRPIRETLSSYLKQNLKEDKYKDADVQIAARMIGGMVIGVTLLNLMEGSASPFNKIQKEKAANTISSILNTGLQFKN